MDIAAQYGDCVRQVGSGPDCEVDQLAIGGLMITVAVDFGSYPISWIYPG